MGDPRPRVTRLLPILALLSTSTAALPPARAAGRGVRVPVRADDRPDARVVGEVDLYRSSHALVVGIGAYTGAWSPLRGTLRDARVVASELEQLGFDVEVALDLDADGLRRRLKRFFVLKGNDPSARLLLWYAGHGHSIDGEGFLVPAGAPAPTEDLFKVDALHMRDFGGLVRLARARHVLAVFDSCFSGTIFSARAGGTPQAITQKTTEPVRQFVTSGDAGQEVSDDGTFARTFLSGVRGDADFNRDGYVTGAELGLHVSQELARVTQAAQTPQHGKLHDVRYNRGDFVFVVPVPEASSRPEMSRGDLETAAQRVETARRAWLAREETMQKDYAWAEGFSRRDVTPDLKLAAWTRFLEHHAGDNPHTGEDERLRAEALRQQEGWRAQVAPATGDATGERSADPVAPDEDERPAEPRGGDVPARADDEALHESAQAALRRFDLAEAVGLLLRLVAEHPDSRHREAASFTAAELQELDRRSAEAAASFEGYAALFPESPRAAEALFRGGLAWHAAERPAEAARVLTAFVQRHGTSADETVRVLRALRLLAEIAAAAGRTNEALELWRRLLSVYTSGDGKPGTPEAELAARARLALAEPEHVALASVRLHGSPAQQGRLLDGLLGETLPGLHAAYESVVELRVPAMSVCALERQASVTLLLADKLQHAPVPPAFVSDQLAAEIYRTQLEETAYPLEGRAVRLLEQAVGAADDGGLTGSCARAARAALARHWPAESVTTPARPGRLFRALETPPPELPVRTE